MFGLNGNYAWDSKVARTQHLGFWCFFFFFSDEILKKTPSYKENKSNRKAQKGEGVNLNLGSLGMLLWYQVFSAS